jgi:hypothetical protein
MKDHGRAEAALIGLSGLNRIPGPARIAAGRIPVNDDDRNGRFEAT